MKLLADVIVEQGTRRMYLSLRIQPPDRELGRREPTMQVVACEPALGDTGGPAPGVRDMIVRDMSVQVEDRVFLYCADCDGTGHADPTRCRQCAGSGLSARPFTLEAREAEAKAFALNVIDRLRRHTGTTSRPMRGAENDSVLACLQSTLNEIIYAQYLLTVRG